MTTPLVGSIEGRIAEELGVRERQVKAAVDLLDGGSTVPFIARYRKEATEMLDDAQLRTLEERLRYLRELEERRTAILESVREQGKLTEEVEAQIRGAETKARLEDIYLPFKPKRRTKAQIAREAAWSRWPRACSATRRSTRSPRRRRSSTRTRASPTRRPRWTAPGRSSPSGSRRTPT